LIAHYDVEEVMERFYVMLPQLNPFSLMNIAIGIENQLLGQHRAESVILPRDKQVVKCVEKGRQ
jgi:hypothetical protein